MPSCVTYVTKEHFMFVKWTLTYLAVSIIHQAICLFVCLFVWVSKTHTITRLSGYAPAAAAGPFFFSKFVGFRADLKKTRKRHPAGTTRGTDKESTEEGGGRADGALQELL